MKELLKKKSVKISILLIILLVVMGIVGINVRSAQRSKEYNDHIAAAEKYLFDLDYEQAIAEYTMAFEIDPKEEVVDALEQAYLAYAQTCIDAGDYENAISILEEGYAKTGRESLQSKIEEFQVIQEEMRAQEAKIQEQKRLEEEQRRLEEERRASGMVEFPFRMTDITIRGYDLFGDYYTQLKELYLAEAEGNVGHGSNEVGSWMGFKISGGGYCEIHENHVNNDAYDVSMSNDIYITPETSGSGTTLYAVAYRSNGPEASLGLGVDYTKSVYSYEEVNVPVRPGETYEDWCRVMQIDQIKENNLRPEERNGMMGIWNDDVCVIGGINLGEGSEYWIFSTEGFQGIYGEQDSEYGRQCGLYFSKPNIDREREEWPIDLVYALIDTDGVIFSISYYGWPIAQ